MTRKERIFRTFQALPVDRPAVNFYGIDGATQNPLDLDRFNIYNDPSWLPLLQLASEKTDRIATVEVPVKRDGKVLGVIQQSLISRHKTETINQRHSFTAVNTPRRILKSEYMTSIDVNTSWCLEHLLKDADDLAAWVALPDEELRGDADVDYFLKIEQKIGDTGAAMIDTLDPLCLVAYMLPMEEFTIIALTEPTLFHQALEKAARFLYWRTGLIADKLPGRLWRIYGPEYATPPYLPPRLFREYVTMYDTKMVDIIKQSGGYARIHCHGNVKEILDDLVSTNCDAIDPIEPPPQGDVELSYVRKRYGRQLVLFGNLEASDIENLEPESFRQKVQNAIHEGTQGEGRGFILTPSASPYGRHLSLRALQNYNIIIEEIEKVGVV